METGPAPDPAGLATGDEPSVVDAGGDAGQFALQLGGAPPCAGDAVGLTYDVFELVDSVESLRVAPDAELEVLDVAHPGTAGHAADQVVDTQAA